MGEGQKLSAEEKNRRLVVYQGDIRRGALGENPKGEKKVR